jgi:co-chaperonin GroES (HSP10)
MSVPNITGVKPCGATVLVEHLTDNEMLGTHLDLPKKSKSVEVQQSYILAIGPALDQSKLGFKVGDRVMVVGSYNPVPKLLGENEEIREKGIVEVYNIRAVLEEQK